MKPKILFLTNDLGLGGVQRLVVDFANYFDKESFEVVVGTLLDRPDSNFYKSRLDPKIPSQNFALKSIYDFRGWFRLYRFLKQEKFDLVFTQLFMADMVGRICAWLAGVPVIVTEIQNIIPSLPKKYTLIDRALKGITTACISTTPAVTDYAMKVVGFPREKIFEIPTNAVDSKRFNIQVDRQKIRANLGIPADAKIAINVGRLVEQKGQSVFLRAASIVLKKEPNIFFLIVGSGRLEEKLKKEAQDLQLGDQVKFLGERHDVPELLMSSDVFVFPSLWEGQGLILFEAMFSKVPIVASNTGGIPDVIKQEETGLLVEPGNPEDLAMEILRILQDKNLSQKLVQNCLSRFGDRTMENSVKKMETLFKDLVLTKRKI